MATVRTEITVHSKVGNAYIENNSIRFQIPAEIAGYSGPTEDYLHEGGQNHYLSIANEDGFFDSLIEALLVHREVQNVSKMP
jgi:hypothetical protein